MIFSKYIKKTVFILCALIIAIAATVPAEAVKVQVFKAAEENVSTKNLRAEAVSQAFAQALLAEAVRMVPSTISSERSNALKDMLGRRYEEFIAGYKDMDVKYKDDGVAVSIDVNVNRQTLRSILKKIGLFSSTAKVIKANISVSNGKYKLSAAEQEKLDAELQSLKILCGVQAVPSTTSDSSASTLTLTQIGKKRWSGELLSANGKWQSSGNTIESVWLSLWAKFYDSANVENMMNPKVTLVVNGWFNPEGVREFGRMLKSWDSAVQEVMLLDVDMKPTAVSASWSLEVSDQWVLKSYLNDYLPPRGLSYNLNGLSEEK